ncbi:MAG: hypothetical protein O3A92_10585 [Verrucomicrobia bacterium]|nr:hypothetical protein [Verrucomicrobiota bacterium]
MIADSCYKTASGEREAAGRRYVDYKTNSTTEIQMKHHSTFRPAAPFLAAVTMLSCLASAAELTKLRCEYRDNPLGIDAAKPRLSWVMEERGQGTGDRGQKNPKAKNQNRKSEVTRGRRQTAYQVAASNLLLEGGP